MFGVLGIPVFDSDTEGKRLLQNDPGVRTSLVEAFGSDVFVDGVLDRKTLGDRVFNDPAALERLNGIVHPAVRKTFAEWAPRQNAPYVINEAAILVETGTYRILDHLIVVTAPEERRIQWVMDRDGVGSEQVLARMRNQAGDAERLRVAHTVINNDGENLVIPQVLTAHAEILRLATR